MIMVWKLVMVINVHWTYTINIAFDSSFNVTVSVIIIRKSRISHSIKYNNLKPQLLKRTRKATEKEKRTIRYKDVWGSQMNAWSLFYQKYMYQKGQNDYLQLFKLLF